MVLCRLESTKFPEPSRIVQIVMVTSIISVKNYGKLLEITNKLYYYFTLNLVMEINTANCDWTRI